MIQIFFTMMFLIPTILGIAEILHFIKIYIINPRPKVQKYVLLFLCGENCFEQLKVLFDEYVWKGKNYAEKIIALDCGIKDCEECLKFAAEKGITVLKNENLVKVLQNL